MKQIRSSKVSDLKFRILIALLVTATACSKEEIYSDLRAYKTTVSLNDVPLTGASISVQTETRIFSSKTDGRGKCLIEIPNNISLPEYTIVTVDHSNIRPRCFTVSGAQNATSDLTISCIEVPDIVRLRHVDLHHLGNDIYGGSANSQLQIASEGLEKTFSYILPAKPGIMPRIQIYARGIEHPLTIYSNGVHTGTLARSATNGNLSLYDFQLNGDAGTIFRSGSNFLTLKTGSTGKSNDPWDDIEFCGILVYYP